MDGLKRTAALLIALSVLFFSANALALEIKTDAFSNGDYISSQYACDSDNVSPSLSWSDVPSEHKTNLSKDIPQIGTLDDGMIQGINDFGKVGYGGPCPPPGSAHRYVFKLYALDSKLDLDENSTKEVVLEAMKGHVIAEAQIFGIYQR